MQYPGSRLNLSFRLGALVAAGGGAQLINFLSIPIVARLFGPAEYGSFSEFYAYFQILLPIAALALPLAIVVADDEYEVHNISRAALIAGLMMTLLITLFFLTLSQIAPARFGWTECLLALIVMAAAIQQTGYQRLMRSELVVAMAGLVVAQAILMSGARIASGLLFPVHHNSLIVASVVAYITFAIITVAIAKRFTPIKSYASDPRSIVQAIAARVEFPMYRAPQMLINGIGRAAPILFLSYVSTSELTGQFAIAFTVLGAAQLLVGNAIGGVFFPKLARVFREKGSHYNVLIRATGGALLLGALGYGFILFVGPSLFGLVLGEDWASGGKFAQLMTPWFIASLAARPATDSIAVYGLNQKLFTLEVVSFTPRIGSLILGFWLSGPFGAIMAFSALNLLIYSALIAFVCAHAKSRSAE